MLPLGIYLMKPILRINNVQVSRSNEFSLGVLAIVIGLFSGFVNAKVPIILVSIDGFSQNYLSRFELPNLSQFATQGVVAEAMVPIFPSKTFPNHISIVTGVYPVKHGIVGNKFYREEVDKIYSMGDGKFDSSWLTAKPIWTIAEQQGKRSAVYFWPESETRVEGILPTEFYFYLHDRPNQQRVEQVKTWLALEEQKQPDFIALYFSIVDSAGHDYGRDSSQVKNAVLEADRLIGDLMHFIDTKLSGQANLVVVSDHGMSQIDKTKIIYWLDHISPSEKTIVVEEQTQLFVYSDDRSELERFKKVFSANDIGARVYTKPDYPKRWQWQKDEHNRLPDLVVDLSPPKTFSSIQNINEREENSSKYYAETHGYDPYLFPEMNAIFLARGPAFKKGYKLSKFENIHVFALLEILLELNPTDNVDASSVFIKESLKLSKHSSG